MTFSRSITAERLDPSSWNSDHDHFMDHRRERDRGPGWGLDLEGHEGQCSLPRTTRNETKWIGTFFLSEMRIVGC